MEKLKLKEIREERELTKRAVAHILGVSDSIYVRWENSKDTIPTRRIYQLANYYQLNIDYLLGLSNKKIHIISDNEINMDLSSTRVAEIRNDFQESLRTFTKRLNTTSSTWSAYEKGKVLILCSFLLEICKLKDYSVDWILGRTDKKFHD